MKLIRNTSLLALSFFAFLSATWAESFIPLDAEGKYFCEQKIGDKTGTVFVVKSGSSTQRALSKKEAQKIIKKSKLQLGKIKSKTQSKKGKAKQSYVAKQSALKANLQYLSKAIQRCLKGKAESPCEAVGGTLNTANANRLVNGHVCNGLVSPVVYLRISFAEAEAACSGTVIRSNPLVVLTAAHCIGDEELGNAIGVRALVGSEEFEATSAYQHPLYSLNSGYDVGIVYFDNSATTIPAVKGLGAGQVSSPEKGYVAAGYGHTTPGEDPSGADGNLRAGQIAILGTTGTSIVGTYVSYLSGLCFGDSGGSLLLYAEGAWRILGVNSAISDQTQLCGIGSQLLFTDLATSPTNRAFLYDHLPEFFQNE